MPTRGRPRHRAPPGNTGAGRPDMRRPRRPERRAARPRRAGCGRSPTRGRPGQPSAPRPASSAERRASRASAAASRPRAPRRCRAAPAPVAWPDRGPGARAPSSPIPVRPPRQPSRRRTGRAGGAAAGPSLRASCRGNYGGRRWELSVFSVWFRSKAREAWWPPAARGVGTRRYTALMRSVADGLRQETRRGDSARTPGERLRLALALGDADCQLAAAYRGITAAEVRRGFARVRQHGRVRSACHESLLV